MGAFAAFLAIAWFPVSAQTVSCNTGLGCTTGNLTLSLTVPRVAQLTVSASSLSLANNNLAAEDYTAGFKNVAATLTVQAWADTGAVVTMSAASTNFSYTPSTGIATTKAASTLQASINGGTAAGLTTAGTTVLTIGAGGSAGSNPAAATISFKYLLGYATDPPGTYSLTINFTVTAP
jgi:hypothetical protein